MKTSKKIEMLRILKQRVAPFAVASTLIVSASGCCNNEEKIKELNDKIYSLEAELREKNEKIDNLENQSNELQPQTTEVVEDGLLSGKYDYISDEFTSKTGDIIRLIGIPNDSGYAYGIYSVTQQKEIIPCKTYLEIKENDICEEYEYMGKKEDGTWVNLVPIQKEKVLKR